MKGVSASCWRDLSAEFERPGGKVSRTGGPGFVRAESPQVKEPSLHTGDGALFSSACSGRRSVFSVTRDDHVRHAAEILAAFVLGAEAKRHCQPKSPDCHGQGFASWSPAPNARPYPGR